MTNPNVFKVLYEILSKSNNITDCYSNPNGVELISIESSSSRNRRSNREALYSTR